MKLKYIASVLYMSIVTLGTIYFLYGNFLNESRGPQNLDNNSEIIINKISRDEYEKTLSSLNNIDDKIDYVLNFGEKGNDFVFYDTVQQEGKLGSTRDENNNIIWSFLARYSYPFLINNRESFIVVTTKNPINQNRDMFIALNGESKGPIVKGQDLSERGDNRYVFNVRNIPAPNMSDKKINLSDFTDSKGQTKLSFAVGEAYNTVTQIVIIYLK